MATLLIEIGCEELPASACRAAEAAAARTAGPGAEVLVGPRRLAVIASDVPEVTADEWVKGPPENLREQGRRRASPRSTASSVDDLELRDGFFGLTLPGRALRDTLPGDVEELVRGLAFGKSMVWVAGGLRFARPVRWLCVKLDKETIAVDVEGIPSGGVSYGHRFTHGEVKIASARRLREGAARRGRRAGPGGARADDPRRARRARGSDDPNPRVLGEVVYLDECADRPRGRASTSASSSCRSAWSRPRWSRTSATSRSAGTGSRSSRTAAIPTLVTPRERAGARRAARGRVVHVRARRRRGHRGAGREARLDHVRRRRGHVCRQDGAADGARRGARRGRRIQRRRHGSRRPTRPRSSSASSPTSRATSAPSTRAWPDSPTRSAWRSRSSTCPTPPTAPLAAHRGRARARRGGQDRQPRRRLRARKAADRLARPVRPAPCGDRPLPPGGRGRARDRREDARRARPRAPHRPERRGEGRPIGRLGLRDRAARRAPRRPGGVRPRRPARPGSRTSARSPASPRRSRPLSRRDEFAKAYTAFDRTNRLAGRADGAAKQLDPKLATEPAEIVLVERALRHRAGDRRRRLRGRLRRGASRPQQRSARRSTRSSTTCS